ncbi:hypothetical protein EVAR_93123_1 [Eumeta japonica]|uniref:Uncharacterized protein n=1 Tax=Eumeta variegata TaxID=151549 RepID=A0A4C1TFB1_EUMVA|nr:hypothetical protein EVAR_93123_1 [Eumeta japonica]
MDGPKLAFAVVLVTTNKLGARLKHIHHTELSMQIILASVHFFLENFCQRTRIVNVLARLETETAGGRAGTQRATSSDSDKQTRRALHATPPNKINERPQMVRERPAEKRCE